MKFMISTLSIVLCATLASAATIPDLNMSYWEHGLTADAGICVCPSGDGDPLTAMRTAQGTVDGTITVVLLDALDQPIANFPAEDIWLESLGMSFCLPPPTADGPTDADGRTTFSGSPIFLGSQTGALLVVVNGQVLPDADGDRLRFASTDLDGSGYVNLTDLILFADRYFSGTYHADADFYFDGRLGLSDVIVLAEHMQHQCP